MSFAVVAKFPCKPGQVDAMANFSRRRCRIPEGLRAASGLMWCLTNHQASIRSLNTGIRIPRMTRTSNGERTPVLPRYWHHSLREAGTASWGKLIASE